MITNFNILCLWFEYILFQQHLLYITCPQFPHLWVNWWHSSTKNGIKKQSGKIKHKNIPKNTAPIPTFDLTTV